MTPSEWFVAGFYIGFGALASTLLVMGGFTLIMAVIESIDDKRSEKRYKEQQKREWAESMEASYRRYRQEHPDEPDPWAENCEDGYVEEGE